MDQEALAKAAAEAEAALHPSFAQRWTWRWWRLKTVLRLLWPAERDRVHEMFRNDGHLAYARACIEGTDGKPSPEGTVLQGYMTLAAYYNDTTKHGHMSATMAKEIYEGR